MLKVGNRKKILQDNRFCLVKKEIMSYLWYLRIKILTTCEGKAMLLFSLKKAKNTDKWVMSSKPNFKVHPISYVKSSQVPWDVKFKFVIYCTDLYNVVFTVQTTNSMMQRVLTCKTCMFNIRCTKFWHRYIHSREKICYGSTFTELKSRFLHRKEDFNRCNSFFTHMYLATATFTAYPRTTLFKNMVS